MSGKLDGSIRIGTRLDNEELVKDAKELTSEIAKSGEDANGELQKQLDDVTRRFDRLVKDREKQVEKIQKLNEQVVESQKKLADIQDIESKLEQSDMSVDKQQVQQEISDLMDKITEEERLKIQTEIETEQARKKLEEEIRLIEAFYEMDIDADITAQIDETQFDAEWISLKNRMAELTDDEALNLQFDGRVQQYEALVGSIQVAKVEQELLNNELTKAADYHDQMYDNAQKVRDNVNSTRVEIALANQDLHGARQAFMDLQRESAKNAENMAKMSRQAQWNRIQAEDMVKAQLDYGKKLDDNRSKQKSLNKETKGLGKGIKGGIKSIAKYAMALLSLRTVYAAISQSANAWLSSTDQAARQMQVNLDYLKVSFGSLLSGPLQAMMNMLYKIAGLIGSIIYAFTGINVFANYAKSAAGSMGQAAKSAKDMAKSLAPFDEKQTLAPDTDTGGGGGGGGGIGDLAPDLIDIHQFDEIANKIKAMWDKLMKDLQPFFDTIKSIDFRPMIDAWAEAWTQMQGTFDVFYRYFITTMNDMLAPFIKIMAEKVIPYGFLVLADILESLNPLLDFLLNDLLVPIQEWFMLELVPTMLLLLFDVLNLLAPIFDILLIVLQDLWELIQPFAAFIGEVVIFILELVREKVQQLNEFLTENSDEIANIITALTIAIGLYTAFKVAMEIIGALNNPFTWIVVAIAAIIKIMEILGIDWNDIVQFFSETIDDLKDWFGELKENLSGVFGDIKDIVSEVASFLGDAFTVAFKVISALLSPFFNLFTSIFSSILSFVGRVINRLTGIFGGLVEFVAGVFTGDWSRAWNGVVRIFDNIISGIVNVFIMPLNALVRMLNFFIRQLNKIQVPKWVPLAGGKGINIPPISQVPYLAKGGIINRPTMAMVGEAGTEAVVPLERNTEGMKMIAEMMTENLGGMGVGNDGVIALHVNLDGREIARKVVDINETDRFARNK